LKQYKTPFLIALNKIDLMPGWRANKDKTLMDAIQSQQENVQINFERKLYEVVEKLGGINFQADRFDRVSDYTRQIAIVPISAKTGEGIPELLMVTAGLCQKYLGESLVSDSEDYAKGTIIEVKEEKGLGKTLDVIIYHGKLRQNDIIVVGTLDEPVVGKVRCLFEPSQLADMRDKKTKFSPVKEVTAATGVKVSGSDIEGAVAGMPLRSCRKEDVEKVKRDIKKEVSEVIISSDREGIVVKADSLGSLEAVEKIFRENSIGIKKASIGPITKNDLADAEVSFESEPLNSVVIGFNVDLGPDVKVGEKVSVIRGDIIYNLIDQIKSWQESVRKKIEAKELEFLTRPCKIKILRGYVFRQSNPAVVGVEVMGGSLKTGMSLMKNDGAAITSVKSIEKEQENVGKIEKGSQAAVSLTNVSIGRQVHEETVLYSFVPEEHFKKLKTLKKYLSSEEMEILREIAEMMRRGNPMWGV
ncbi:translation initiation factor IF-2, partial [Candidatus Woesearchaeota archaeon]|nr:translation initiation factor IF-2 [Candidatus Woesearchaeota archaeon]